MVVAETKYQVDGGGLQFRADHCDDCIQLLLTSNIFELSIWYTIIREIYYTRAEYRFRESPLERGNAALYNEYQETV